MSDTSLAYDLAPLVLFMLAAILFIVRWLQTGQDLLLITGLVMVLAAAYIGYRVRNLYLR